MKETKIIDAGADFKNQHFTGEVIMVLSQLFATKPWYKESKVYLYFSKFIICITY